MKTRITLRRGFAVLTALLLCAAVCAECFAAPLILNGDVNGDGVTQAADAVCILQYAAGIAVPDAQQREYADIDGDGEITTSDAAAALEMASGIIPGDTYSYSPWEVLTPSTCSAYGTAVSRNLKTGKERYQTLPKEPHTAVPATCTVGSYCAVCGEILSEPLGHTTLEGVCERCNETISLPLLCHLERGEIAFGASAEMVTAVFGQPTEVLLDRYAGGTVSHYVYASDYQKLLILSVSASGGVFSVYTTAPEVRFYAGETTLFRDAKEVLTQGVYRFEPFVDTVGTKETYAVRVCADSSLADMQKFGDFRTYEKLVFHLVNSCRALNGLGVLQYSEPGASAALLHSEDMAKNNYFAHEDLNGGTPYTRLTAVGLNLRACGENIAAGYSSPFALNHGWYLSPGHRLNMLTPEYRQLGVGITYRAGSAYGFYGTEEFLTVW